MGGKGPDHSAKMGGGRKKGGLLWGLHSRRGYCLQCKSDTWMIDDKKHIDQRRCYRCWKNESMWLNRFYDVRVDYFLQRYKEPIMRGRQPYRRTKRFADRTIIATGIRNMSKKLDIPYIHVNPRTRSVESLTSELDSLLTLYNQGEAP